MKLNVAQSSKMTGSWLIPLVTAIKYLPFLVDSLYDFLLGHKM